MTASWCACGLIWMLRREWAHTEAGVRHERHACLAINVTE